MTNPTSNRGDARRDWQRTLGVWRTVALLLGLLTAGRSALAQESVTVRLEIEGPPGCLTREDLEREILARDAKIRFTGGEAPRSFHFRTSEEGSSRALEVISRGPRGASPGRRLVGGSCDELLQAAALIVVLALEEGKSPEARVAIPPARVEAPAPPALRSPPAPPAPPAPAPAPAGPSFVPTIGVGIFGSSLGEGTPGASLTAGLERRAMWLPQLDLSASAGLPRAVAGGGGEANLVWIHGRASACAIRVELARGLDAHPCAFVDIGVLHARGVGVDQAESRSRPWLASGALARLRWTPAPSAPGFFADLDVGGAATLLRDEFVFLNGGSVYRAPPFSGFVTLRAGARFL